MSSIDEKRVDGEKFQANVPVTSDSPVFYEKNLFKEANVELIADEFKLKKQQLYKLVMERKFKGGKVAK